jgi:hypothetical protein
MICKTTAAERYFMRMKQILIIAFVVFMFSLTASAQATPRGLATTVSAAYMSDLNKLDGKRLLNGGLKIIVEHSISGRIEKKRFKSFGSVERWLKKRQRDDGTPFRATGDLGSCGKTSCIIEYPYGILHNHLYLKRIAYGYRSGRRYVKEIRLYDGD